MFGTLDPSLAQIVPQLGAGADGEIVAESGARFRLETVLGAGGFGVVVRARCRVTSAIAYDDRILNGALAVLRELTADGELWVPCALKFIQPSGSRWESFEEFHREAMAWLGCAEPHPHVLRAYGLEFTPTGIPFLQLELARGGSLAGRLANGRLSVRSVVFVLAQIADALMHAGQELSRDAASFSHGDIKPANVLLGEAPRPNPSDRCCCDSCIAEWVQGPLRLPDGGDIRDQLRGLPRPRHLIAKLTDFGMARLASSHDLATPEYMAPEQFDGDRSPAVDVYALGVTAFQLLTGELPFADVHPADEWRSRVWRDVHRHRPPRALREVSPPTPADVAELIDSCLAKRDSDRPALGELKARLEACASAMGFHGTPPTVAHRGPGNHAPGARMRLVRGIEGLVALGTASALGGVEAIGRRMPSEGWEEDGTYSVVKEWEAAAEHQLGVAAGAAEPLPVSAAGRYRQLADAAMPEPSGAAVYVQQNLIELHGRDPSGGLFFYPHWGVDGHVRPELAVQHAPFLGHVLAWELLLALRRDDLPVARSQLDALRARDFLLVQPWRHRLEGLVALAEDATARARESFEAALEADPGDAVARSNLAVALYRRGARGAALEEADRARRELPLHGEVVANWLAASRTQGVWSADHAEALARLPKLRYPVDLKEEPAPVTRWDVHPPLIWDADDAWFTLEALAEVRRILARELERDLARTATDPRSWFQAAAFWAAAGDEGRARRCLERTVRHGAHEADVAQAAAKLGEYLDEQRRAREQIGPVDFPSVEPAPTLPRVLQDHRTALDLAISTMNDAARRDQMPAPAGMLEDTREQAAQQLASVRKEMAQETRDLAVLLGQGQVPADFDVRVLRLSLAAYFLDKVDEMFRATRDAGGAVRAALLLSATRAVRNILDDLYFFKSADQIIRDYLDNETSIASCAAACKVELCSLEQAALAYKKNIAAQIDALNFG